MSMARVLRGAGLVVAGVVGLAAVLAATVAGYGVVAAYRAVPALEGTVALAGLGAPTTVTRDSRGVPWIEADTAADAYAALGYVHAQDRLFQMEMMRRAGAGRLAEILGPLGVGSDKFMRTLGLYRLSEAAVARVSPATREALEAYARGVNAFIAHGPLPLEFKLLVFAPEPWRPADSLVWQKLMGLQLSGNWPAELSRAAVVAKLGAERAAELYPDSAAGSPVSLAALPGTAAAKLRVAMLAVVQPTLASNIWAISGSRTATGAPFLANDPHLNFQAPNLWYLAGLRYPGTTLIGATVPGVPFHLLGHNGSLAWGFTTTHGDTQDLFVETLTEGGYVTPEGPAPFSVRDETIKVRFGAPVTLTVRATRHGPVVSDILPADDLRPVAEGGKLVALAATLLAENDSSSDAIFRMARARSAAAFLAELQNFHAPQQNVMFADTAGAIGYVAAGRVPLRKDTACDGLLPANGATGACDWTGWAPFSALPQSLNPPGGALVNANNKIVPDDYPLLIAKDWPEGYRARRINEVLAGRAGLSMADMIALQHDRVSLMARELTPLLLANLAPRPGRETELRDQLTAWDGTMGRERGEPVVLAVWLERLKTRVLRDELGDLAEDFRGTQPTLLKSILTTAPAWCDDTSTAMPETCAQQVQAAWAETMTWLDAHAPDENARRWAHWHVARFAHPVFGSIPGLTWLGGFAAVTDGDDYTVNRGSFAPSTARVPFRHRHGPGYRAIYDLAELSRSQFAVAGGQSAHVASPHFDDLLADWADGRMFALVPPAPSSGSRILLTPSP